MLSLIYTVIQLSKCWRNLISDELTPENKLKIKENMDRVLHNYETRNRRYTNARYTPKNRDEPGAEGDDEDTYEISAVLDFMRTLYDELLQKLRDALRASAEEQSTIEMEVDPDPRDDEFRLRLTLPHGVTARGGTFRECSSATGEREQYKRAAPERHRDHEVHHLWPPKATVQHRATHS